MSFVEWLQMRGIVSPHFPNGFVAYSSQDLQEYLQAQMPRAQMVHVAVDVGRPGAPGVYELKTVIEAQGMGLVQEGYRWNSGDLSTIEPSIERMIESIRYFIQTCMSDSHPAKFVRPSTFVATPYPLAHVETFNEWLHGRTGKQASVSDAGVLSFSCEDVAAYTGACDVNTCVRVQMRPKGKLITMSIHVDGVSPNGGRKTYGTEAIVDESYFHEVLDMMLDKRTIDIKCIGGPFPYEKPATNHGLQFAALPQNEFGDSPRAFSAWLKRTQGIAPANIVVGETTMAILESEMQQFVSSFFNCIVVFKIHIDRQPSLDGRYPISVLIRTHLGKYMKKHLLHASDFTSTIKSTRRPTLDSFVVLVGQSVTNHMHAGASPYCYTL